MEHSIADKGLEELLEATSEKRTSAAASDTYYYATVRQSLLELRQLRKEKQEAAKAKQENFKKEQEDAKQKAKLFVDMVNNDAQWLKRKGGWEIWANGSCAQLSYTKDAGFAPPAEELLVFFEVKYGLAPTLTSAEMEITAFQLASKSLP